MSNAFLSNVLLVARLTVGQAYRRRVFIAGFVVSALFLALYAIGAHLAFDEMRAGIAAGETPGGPGAAPQFLSVYGYIFLVLGTFAGSISGALVAVFMSAGSVSTEIEDGTLQAFAARPISRKSIIIGKFGGQLTVLAVYLSFFYLAMIAIVHSESGWAPSNVPLVLAIFLLHAVVVLTVALFGSTFLSTAANGVAVMMLYTTALVSGFLEQIGAMIGKDSLAQLGTFTGLIMPTDGIYRFLTKLLEPSSEVLQVAGAMSPGNSILGPFGVANVPSIWVIIYGLVFITAMILGSVAVFSRRDL